MHPELTDPLARWSDGLRDLVMNPLIPCIVTLGPLWLLVDLAHLVPRFGMWLLRKGKLKGVLLSFGTLLFLFAKGILVVNLIREGRF